jgi:hypothetical protein
LPITADPEVDPRECPRERFPQRDEGVPFSKVVVDLTVPGTLIPLADKGGQFRQLFWPKRVDSILDLGQGSRCEA